MKRRNLLALAAFLTAGVAAPASAAWDRIGAVEFSQGDNRDTQYGNFGGSVEALALQARDADVTCRNVTATFRNGQKQRVFRGSLPRGRVVAINLPGRERFVSRLDFNCRAVGRRGTTVDISADVGRYQDEWRRSPDWEQRWSGMFSWGNNRPGDNNGPGNGRHEDRDRGGPLDASGWITLGSEEFSGRSDREVTFTGWQGRNLDALAFRPVNDDARCRSVTATFANGDRRDLSLDNGDMLRRDRITTIDLPGNRRDVTRIDMNCHAEHGGSVTIQVLASR